jgi:hypothetical protein
MSPNTDHTGKPIGFIEKNNTIFFDYLPDYDKSDGGKLFYRLVPSYFTTSDTSKKPGFVEAFHPLLSICASYDWLLINKSENVTLLNGLRDDRRTMEDDLVAYIRQKNPTRMVITGRVESSR